MLFSYECTEGILSTVFCSITHKLLHFILADIIVKYQFSLNVKDVIKILIKIKLMVFMF